MVAHPSPPSHAPNAGARRDTITSLQPGGEAVAAQVREAAAPRALAIISLAGPGPGG
jgi:hypothetical protein